MKGKEIAHNSEREPNSVRERYILVEVIVIVTIAGMANICVVRTDGKLLSFTTRT
jgi:hypothetical protein